MNRKFVIVMIVGLFLLPALYSPQNLSMSSDVLPRQNEPQTVRDFALSADGAESSESITSFSETLAEDVMFYPDALYNDTALSGSSLSTYDTLIQGDLASTYSEDSDWIQVNTENGTAYIDLNFTIPVNTEYVNYIFDCSGQGGDDYSNISVYDWSSDTWTYLEDITQGSFANVTGSVPTRYLDTQVCFRVASCDADAIGTAFLEYASITSYYMTLADSENFAESFYDVSDWTTSDTSIATNDDVATITENGAGSTGRAYASFDSTDFFEYYYEFSISTMTATTANLEFWDGAAYNTLKTFTAAGTYKGIISDTDAETMQRIGFLVGSEGGNIKPDYLRISKSNETGWQNDGSTTQAISSSDGGTIATDGDLMTLTADGDGSTFIILADTTTTASSISCTYYPMFGIDIDSGSGSWTLEQYDGSAYATLQSSTAISAGIKRFNMRALDTYVSQWKITLSASAVLVEDWAKAYSIANYTFSQHASTPVTDYLYVNDDSELVRVATAAWYMELNLDSVLSVDTSTYNVCNITFSELTSTGGTSDYGFLEYVGASRWIYDTSRFALTSGTMTDCRILISNSITISAITFIEDGTAPTVVRSFATPDPASDDETVTLSAVVEDLIEVYSVKFNAIVYPVGFSDVDYSATEQSDNLWTYSFTSLLDGYYCFKIIGSDGANENALTEYGYISFTVREAEITVETYTLFGAGSDFTYIQYSGHISHDCTFTIQEWSDTWAINETHTGSVTAGDFNIAWDKIGVNDVDANYTITFTNASLTKVITSSYQTAYKLLRIADIDCDNLEASDNWATNITINFYTNKAVDWYIYDRDDNDAVLLSGSSVEGNDIITWAQDTARGAHYFAVKWTDGVSNEWYNASYWIFDRNIDDLPGGGDLGADARKSIQMWTTIGAIIGFVGLVVLGITNYRLGDMKKVQLPHYETQPSTREERRKS